MIVGLYDQDLENLGFCPPNLELMKIAQYYKCQGDIVSLTTSHQAELFTKCYYAQDYEGPTDHPLLAADNITFGGRQLTGDENWLPQGIMIMPSDPSIYRRAYNKLSSEWDKYLGDRIIEMEHLRLSLDGKTIWKDYQKQLHSPSDFRTIMIHDKDITAIKGSRNELHKLLNQSTSGRPSLATKYPIRIHNSQELYSWAALHWAKHLHMFEVDYTIYGNDISKLGGHTVQYNITVPYQTEKEFLAMGLAQIVLTVINFQRFGNSVLLIYEPEKITTPTVRMLIDTISDYSVGGMHPVGLGSFVSNNYPGDLRILVKLLNYTAPDALQLLKENM